MSRTRFDREVVVLEPDGDNGVSYTLQPTDDGKIAVALKVDTETLGQFCIPLRASHFSLIVSVGKELLALPEDKVQQLRRELLEAQEKENNDER